MSFSRDQLSSRSGKVDPTNGKKGTVVSLDLEEYEKFAIIAGCPRIEGDDGPGELVQPFDNGDGNCFCNIVLFGHNVA